MTDVLRIKRRTSGAAGAPASLAIGELAYNEIDGGLYIGRSNGSVVQVNSPGSGGNVSNSGTPANGQWAQWTDATHIQGVATASMPFLPLTGGTLTGALVISYATPGIALRKTASGQTAAITGSNGTNARWAIELGNVTAESGSNAGSDFAIDRYNDAGTFIDSPMTINRAGGGVTISAGANIAGSLTAGFVVSSGSGAAAFRATQATSPTANGEAQLSGVRCLWAAGYSNNTSWLLVGNQWYIYADFANGVPFGSVVSDVRLKQDIAPSESDCLALIERIPVHQFRWREKPDALNPIGLIAQELYEIEPSLAIKPPDDVPALTFWGIDQGSMIAALVGAVQQLTARVQQLETAAAEAKRG
jgi:hypothetical protein